MNFTLKSVKSLKGKISLPSSKSYSIRAAMIAACGGKSQLINMSDCDDAHVAMRVIKSLGVSIKQKSSSDFSVTVPSVLRTQTVVRVGESGTVLRFVLPLLAIRAKGVIVEGVGTLRGRPNKFLIDTLKKMGSVLEGTGPTQSIPILFNGGSLHGGKVQIDGSLSSQFISALLIACPQLEEDTRLILTGGKVVSADYIDMTLKVLEVCNIKIVRKSPREFLIEGRQKFNGLKKFIVPSDYGLAAFLMAAAVLTKSDVKLTGHFDDRFVQADGAILDLLKKMGAKFKKTDQFIELSGPQSLTGGNFSLKDCPDLVPIMSILALFAKGKTRLYDIAHVRAKESDRISDLRQELLKIGADVKETSNELIINPLPQYNQGCTLDPRRDHRLAMSFSVLGLRIGTTVKDIECSAKSYPSFVKDLKSLIRK